MSVLLVLGPKTVVIVYLRDRLADRHCHPYKVKSHIFCNQLGRVDNLLPGSTGVHAEGT